MKSTYRNLQIGMVVFIFLNTSIISAQDARYVKFENQEVEIADFKAAGLILDIGGGGEGVIGQLKGDQVISIDLYRDELVDAPSSNLKIVMDARDLKFIDNSFNTAVIFYTLMYINGKDHEKVIQEAKRVLKYGGRLIIWDVNLPVWKDTAKTAAYFPFVFKLPNKEISTGYGVSFPKEVDYDLDYYVKLASKEGFNVIKRVDMHPSFYLELQRTPLSPIPSIADTLQQVINNKGIAQALQMYKRLKQTRSDDFIFTSKALEKLCSNLYYSGKVKESIDILMLCINEYNYTEEVISQSGYLYLNEGFAAESIELFKLNIQKYPMSSSAYSNLADAYLKAGDKQSAMLNCTKALELNPENTNAAKILAGTK